MMSVAGVAELADAQDLKSWVPQGACGFDSRPRHQFVSNFDSHSTRRTTVELRQGATDPVLSLFRIRNLDLARSEQLWRLAWERHRPGRPWGREDPILTDLW